VNEAGWPGPVRAWWTVIVLTFAYVVSFVDRTILSLLIEPIKADLALSDTQIALVQGLAFALFYAAMGLPLGWLADRMSRRLLIALGAGFWCIATAACGLAGSFAQLFVARIGVGVGEAALSPAALSLISDSFPKERRALPIGIYAGAAALGAGLALIVGGSVIGLVSQAQSIVLPAFGEVAPWQAAFIAVGLFGLVLLPLMATVLEPVRHNEHAVAVAGPAPRIDRFIREHAGFMVRHYVAVSVYTVLIYGALSWIPAHLIREFGLSPAEVGLRYGVVLLVFGGAGTIVGATLASWLARRDVAQAPIIVTTLGMACSGPILAQAAWADSAAAALAWYGPGLLCLTLPGGTAIQVIQEAVPNALRGQASAIYYLCNSLLGLSLGPLSVALLTDRFYGDPARVGDALAWVAMLIGPSTALLAYSTRRPFGRMIGQQRSGAAA
jgi:MFS family permease